MRKLNILFLAVALISCGTKNDTDVETCKVRNGIFYIDLVEEGEIKATSAINISSPPIDYRFQLKITQIIEDGEKVEIGDTVIMFDPSEVEKAILDAEAELEIAKAEMEKMKAQHESKIEELRSNIEISELSHRISEIRLEQATFDSEVTRKEIGLNLEKAKIALSKARDEIVNQRKIHQEEIKQSVLKISQLRANLGEAQKTLKMLTLVTPAPGIAIIRKNWLTDNKWQVGDQTWTGNPIIDLPDLDEMKVLAEISEVDISKVRLGLEAEIRLDAFSDTVYTGKVISIANLAQFKDRDSKIKIFPVEVLIDGSSDKFLPGMTVSCRIIIDQIEEALFIPLEGLFDREAEQFVYVRSGGSFERREVITGQKNSDHIIIREGLNPDELIALSDPFPGDEQLNKFFRKWLYSRQMPRVDADIKINGKDAELTFNQRDTDFIFPLRLEIKTKDAGTFYRKVVIHQPQQKIRLSMEEIIRSVDILTDFSPVRVRK